MTCEHEDWVLRAACVGCDPGLFFPGRGNNADDREAKAVCAVCPVRAECLAVGMTERYGIWGGLSERERRTMRKSWPHRGRFLESA